MTHHVLVIEGACLSSQFLEKAERQLNNFIIVIVDENNTVNNVWTFGYVSL